jgi:hypothetical protein
LRAGVTVRESSRKTSASTPVVWIMFSVGFAPARPVRTSQTSSASGTSPFTRRTNLAKRGSFI